MAEHDLYIDCDRAAVVTSATDASRKELPKFVQGDTMLLRIFLLKGFSRTADYQQLPTEGLTLQVALGTRVGNATLYYTQQFTWTPSEDLANPYFEAELPMSTAAITTLLGSADSARAYFEIKYIRSGLPTTVLSEQVTIFAAVIKDGGFTEPTEPTPMSVEVANALYVKQSGFQGSLILISPDGTKQAELYYGDDGALHVDPIT
jgi:hypothetical protein